MQFISAISVVVPDYDQAIAFYVGKLGFTLIEDTRISENKRWVLVAPYGSRETRLLLAKAVTDKQNKTIGNQTGGRVFLFLHTDNFAADFSKLQSTGIRFCESPREESYGKVAVFEDPFGNRWDLIQSS